LNGAVSGAEVVIETGVEVAVDTNDDEGKSQPVTPAEWKVYAQKSSVAA